MSPKILDRYLARQFLLLFLMCYISLAGLYTVVDAFTNLDNFLNYAQKHGNLLGTMLAFYAFRWLAFFDLTSGVLALISAMFTLSLFQSRNEMTALLAAGIPKGRISTPVIVAAISVSFLAASGREFIVPRYAKQLSQDPRDLAGEAAQPLTPRYDNKTDILLGGRSTTANGRRIRSPNFQLPSGGLNRYGRHLEAEEAVYEPPTDNRPGGYRLRGVREPVGLTQKPSVVGKSGRPEILCPSDTPWLKPGECFVISDVDFDQLAGQGLWRHQSTVQLIRTLKNPSLDYGADVKVAIHARVVKPLLDVTLLLLGLPLVLSREHHNVFLAVAKCLGVVTIFMISVYACQYLGSAIYISPQLAAWLPLIIFVPLAAAMSEPLFE